MVPIDGSFTMGQPLMVDVVEQLQAKVVMPMHYWGRYQLERFMTQMERLEPNFVVPDRPIVELSKEDLPEKLTVIAVGGNGGD